MIAHINETSLKRVLENFTNLFAHCVSPKIVSTLILVTSFIYAWAIYLHK